MMKALVIVSSGIIAGVKFFDDALMAVKALSEYVKSMNIEKDDAAVFGPEGQIANAKQFLDENDEYFENRDLIEDVAREKLDATFIIGNPQHPLRFMVASPDDPLGFNNPVEALSELGQMRQEFGRHLKLYRVTPVDSPVAERASLEKHNADLELEDFDVSVVEGYLL
jgi:hypothetical protein